MKTLTVKVPEALDAQLSALARRKRLRRSVVVRRALSRYLATSDRPGRGSFLERARDLVGCVNGPPDLSVAERHTKGYGR